MITRGNGRSAVAAAAYMSCSRIENDYDGITHDYTRKRGLHYERVFLPVHAPPEWKDRAVLWNAVETAEKTKDSRLAREIIVALPVELSLSQNICLLEEYAQTQFVDLGMCADVCIHDDDGHNPHAHIMLTVRPLKDNGKWQSKTEKEYLCIKDGIEKGFTSNEFLVAKKNGWEKQYLYKVGNTKKYLPPSQAVGLERSSKYPKSSRYGRENPSTKLWNSNEQLLSWRKAWADEVNRHLERAGFSDRIDHRSFKSQGILRQPTIHEGVFAIRMERKGKTSDRREINRRIIKDNSALAYWTETVIYLTKALIMLIPAVAVLLEALRMKLTVLLYDWKLNRYNMTVKQTDIEYMKREVPRIEATNSKLDAKAKEKSELEAELRRTPKLFRKKRAELEAKIYGLNEEISELTTEQNRLTHVAGNTVEIAERRISAAEERLKELEDWDDYLSVEIHDTVVEFKEKASEAQGLDREALSAERMKLRPQKYAEAYDKIEKQYGICNMDRLMSSQINASDLLDEEPDKEILFPKPETKLTSKTKHKDEPQR